MESLENINYRLRKTEDKIDILDDKIDKMMTNHLPHLSQDVALLKKMTEPIDDMRIEMVKLRTRVMVTAGVNVAIMILGLVVSKMF